MLPLGKIHTGDSSGLMKPHMGSQAPTGCLRHRLRAPEGAWLWCDLATQMAMS